jgi:hypothetical protein
MEYTMEAKLFDRGLRKLINNNSYNYKIDSLYKYISEGWSPAMAEAKAGLRPSMNDYRTYEDSEHYLRVRNIYANARKRKLSNSL